MLRRAALADGIIDAAFNVASEVNRRPEDERSPKWIHHWIAAISRGVSALEAEIDDWPDSLDMAAIAAGCAMAYLDFRLKDHFDWREHHPRVAAWYEAFSKRESMQATAPKI